ncbi:MAG: peptidoglycan-binding protein, partial [Patescibacteria group bacterium]
SGAGGGGGIAPVIPTQDGAVAAVSAPVTIFTAPTIPAAAVAAPSSVAVEVSPVFSKVLKVGITSPDVKRLQQLLNSDLDTKIAGSGVGSSGKESEYFGSLTEKALQKFQSKYGIVSSGSAATTGYGLVGKKTMAKLEEVFGKATPAAPAVAAPSSVAVSVSPVFNSSLYKGMTSSDVKRLQQLLATDKDVYPEGNTSGYFGALTEKAVERFQEKYGLAKTGDSGYGFVGPKTRAKLNEVFGGEAVLPAAPVAAPVIAPTPVSTPAPATTPNFDWMNLTPAPSPQ